MIYLKIKKHDDEIYVAQKNKSFSYIDLLLYINTHLSKYVVWKMSYK